jgi:serine phosphatase RsbU (regulator of sigma subunit)
MLWSKYLIALTLFLFFKVNTSFSQEVFQIDADFTLREISKNEIYFLEDREGAQGIDDILKPQNQYKFQVLDKHSPNFGISTSAYWLKIKLKKTTDNQIDDYYLELAYASLDSIQYFYQSQDGRWQHQIVGDVLPFSHRKIKHRNFIFPVSLQHNQQQTFYIRIKSNGSLIAPLNLYQESYLRETQVREDTLYGFYYGAMIIMGLYNLFIFFSLKDKTYLIYAITVFINTFVQANFLGHSIQYLWGDYVKWSNYSVPFFSHLIAIFNLLFSISFLQIKKVKTVLYYILISFISLHTFFAFATFLLDYNTSLTILLPANLSSLMLILLSGFWAWLNGSKYARLYVIAWIFYALSVALSILKYAGFLPSSFWTQNSTLIGSLIESVFLAFALSDRINFYRKEIAETQGKLLLKSQENNQLIEEQNELLTQRVTERTEELLKANEEVKTVNDTLQVILNTIQHQKDQILASINYAQRIQNAILPQQTTFEALLPNHFMLFKPKDIVSGDFYYIREIDHKIILAAVDCTGHGVPGAFMSFIGYLGLNVLTVIMRITSANEILKQLHRGIRQILRQKETNSKDGMDMALVVIEKEKKTLTFAGAKNPLIYIQNGELHQIKGDIFGIGGEHREIERNYTLHEVDISVPTTFYLYSDGYQDQFGGANKKKFMSNRFRNLLLEIHSKPMQEQKEILEKTIFDWMDLGKEEQVDDILVMGVRV